MDTGDRVRYRVCPMVHDGFALAQATDLRSNWSPWVELSGEASNGTSVFFNRGLVISQFMARYLERLRVEKNLETQRDALVEFKKSIGQHEVPIRTFLSGVLRTELLGFLAAVVTVYQHYRWLAQVRDMQKRKKNPKGTLMEGDGWQSRHLTGAARRELDFWVR